FAMNVAPAVLRDRPQPSPEGLVVVVGELGELADEQCEDFLHQVRRLGLATTGAPRPVIQQRRVQPDEPLPGLFLLRLAETLQETRGCLHRALSLYLTRGPKITSSPGGAVVCQLSRAARHSLTSSALPPRIPATLWSPDHQEAPGRH